MFEVEFYKLENGERPVISFLNTLDKKMRTKAAMSLQLLEQYGNQLREPQSKYIEDGIFELRIKFSSDITRIFYFFFRDNKIILTNGFIKKTQKTPRSELNKAKKYKHDYERRAVNERVTGLYK